MNDEWAARTVRTPVGALWLVARRERIFGAELEPRFDVLAARLSARDVQIERGRSRAPKRPILIEAAEAVGRYFRGELGALRGVPLDLEGTDVRLEVWRQVRKIRPGRTTTYAALADRVGMRGAFRAIGAANGANPLVLFVPCHRVVASNGKLCGYGAGLPAKSWLLRHEGVDNDGERLVTL